MKSISKKQRIYRFITIAAVLLISISIPSVAAFGVFSNRVHSIVLNNRLGSKKNRSLSTAQNQSKQSDSTIAEVDVSQRSSDSTNVFHDTEMEKILLDSAGDLSTMEEGLLKRKIVVTASISLPFSAELAYDAYSQLPRQPSWSAWLRSVSYVDDNETKSKWVLGWSNLEFSWLSIGTKLERPNIIKWESVSGLKNMGSVQFVERVDIRTLTGVATNMTVTLTFVAPRVVASVLRRSKRVSSFMHDIILKPTLLTFREVVMEEDLDMDIESIKREISILDMPNLDAEGGI